MQHDPNNKKMIPSTSDGTFEICQVCGRSTPFVATIKAGLPLGQICTCALEQRIIERLLRQLRRSAPMRVEGH